MSTCHKWKAGRKGSGSGVGGVRCHATEGVAEERRGGGSVSGSGRQAGVGSIRGSPYNPFTIIAFTFVYEFCLLYTTIPEFGIDDGTC